MNTWRVVCGTKQKWLYLNFEAARAITELSGVTSQELTPAITVLQLFLSSSKPVLRFAVVRTLNKVGVYCSKTIQYDYIF